MNKNPLSILASDENHDAATPKQKSNPRQEAQAKFDRLWLIEPETFDLTEHARELSRLARTLELIEETGSLANKQVADLGCGAGVFSRMMRDAGAAVDAVDISQNALKKFTSIDSKDIRLIQDYMPHTLLEDSRYDIAVAADLIAYLDQSQYRLFFSELARIVKAKGYAVCSTAIDIYSENALQQFAELAATEFDNFKWIFSYHFLQIKLLDYFKAPKRFARAAKDKLYREKALSKRYSVARWWFKVNSTAALGAFWRLITPLSTPFCSLLERNGSLLIFLEKLSKMLWGNAAISHAIFIAERRPLFPPLTKEEQPKELKHKKQVWE